MKYSLILALAVLVSSCGQEGRQHMQLSEADRQVLIGILAHQVPKEVAVMQAAGVFNGSGELFKSTSGYRGLEILCTPSELDGINYEMLPPRWGDKYK